MARNNEGIHIARGGVIIRRPGDWGRIGQDTGLTRRNMPDQEDDRDLPSFSEIEASLPKGAIARDAIVVPFMREGGKKYVLLQPRKRTKEGWVYVPVN